MRDLAARLETFAKVVPFDYPYRVEGRRAPDRPPVLIASHRAALERLEPETHKVALVGKSMGSRIGCHVAVEASSKPGALVCLGYPLVGQRGALRDQVLLELETPILFVQGTRDPLCPLEALAKVRARMKAPNELIVIEGGDHSLELSRAALTAQGTTQDRVNDQICAQIREFLENVT